MTAATKRAEILRLLARERTDTDLECAWGQLVERLISPPPAIARHLLAEWARLAAGEHLDELLDAWREEAQIHDDCEVLGELERAGVDINTPRGSS